MTDQNQDAQVCAQAEQFSTYVKMAEALTERQATVIRYNISLHAAMVGAGGALFVSAFSRGDEGGSIYLYAFLFVICTTGAFFAQLWRDALERLRYWSSVKYKIIREVEESEPYLMELYAREWKNSAEQQKKLAHERSLAMPAAFLWLYRMVGLLVALALAIRLDREFFAGGLLQWLDALIPGAAALLG